MSDLSTYPSVTEKLQELQGLNQQRELLVKRHAVLQSRHAQANRDLLNLRKEMEEVGTSPETIEADVTKAKLDLNQAVSKYRQDLDSLGLAIEQAESVLGN
jgi:chromosome segregation ATPase